MWHRHRQQQARYAHVTTAAYLGRARVEQLFAAFGVTHCKYLWKRKAAWVQGAGSLMVPGSGSTILNIPGALPKYTFS